MTLHDSSPRNSDTALHAALVGTLIITFGMVSSHGLFDRIAALTHVSPVLTYVFGLSAGGAVFELFGSSQPPRQQMLEGRIPQTRRGPVLVVAALFFSVTLCYAYARLMAAHGLRLLPFDAAIRCGPLNVTPVVVLFLGPAAEEFYYRRVLYTRLLVALRHPLVFGVANAAWFAAGHVGPAIPAAFVVGIAATTARTTTGSLLAAVIVHSASNAALAFAAVG